MRRSTSILPYLEFHITDHCNLNCKSCTHFAPLSEKNFLSIDSFIKDMTRLSDLFLNISRMRILGGEPLLHPQINYFIEASRKFFPKSNISLVTNGILLPSMDNSFYQSLKAYKISLDITIYPVIKHELSSNVFLASKYEIPVEYQNVEYFSRFLNINGDSDRDKIHNQCWINYCTFLREGKIYPCCIPALVYLPNREFGWNIPNDGFIDIHTEVSGRDILDFIRQPISTCAYCTKPIWSQWQLSNRHPDEWIV